MDGSLPMYEPVSLLPARVVVYKCRYSTTTGTREEDTSVYSHLLRSLNDPPGAGY